MYEFGLDEAQHLKVPQGTDPLQLFLLTIGTLGDVSELLADSEYPLAPLHQDQQSELNFCASFFDAILDSKFASGLERTTLLLAAAAYYLAQRPGSSLVLAKRIEPHDGDNKVEHLLQWLLKADWGWFWELGDERYGSLLTLISQAVHLHFKDGSRLDEIGQLLKQLRSKVYRFGTPEELLYADTALSICRMRLAASAWVTLPAFSGLSAEQWKPVIQRNSFPKELWPSQIMLGERGLFSGASGLVQMPTSAGKTRSIEIILRSAFMSGRTKLAVVVAPFRALCHEIAASLRQDLVGDDIKVNELTDALQIDFVEQVAEFFGNTPPLTSYVLVLTPEKFLYVLRQSPQALNHVGLVAYDEGHQFDTGGRGITYELLLTEIKGFLPDSAQIVLISAVMQNPQAIATWLMGQEKGQVVDGTTLLPTSRSVAFASWAESLGQLMFYESGYEQHDYFVPKVIEASELKGLKPDDSHFPDRQKSSDVSLYLGLRVANNGAVAIFCGTKAIANGIAKRAVQIANAGYSTTWPSSYANPGEVSALRNVIAGNFGSESLLSKAAKLGIYTHHSNTPHGIRLALEYGMQKGLISFIACTSTLAQGVNLPIRYLIVQGVNQGAGRVKVRDFQNLIGRAGRAGMHTEGIVLFADSTVYDNRLSNQESWKFRSAVELLSPNRAEGVTSSLLLLLAPFSLSRTLEWRFSADELLSLIDDESSWESWALWLANQVPRLDQSKKNELSRRLRKSLAERRKMTHTLESYLMANRATENSKDFVQRAGELALGTLAYSLATADQATKLEEFFKLVAQRVESVESSPAKQASFGKTLLGVKHAKRIEAWGSQNREALLRLDSNESWLAAVWPLFAELCDNRFFRSVVPSTAGYQLALSWMRGTSYGDIFKQAAMMDAKKKAGSRQQKVGDDDVLDFLESALAFDCALILAALAQFLFGPAELLGEQGAPLASFQKSLKNGLPDTLSMSAYEGGFADRFIAQAIRDALIQDGFEGAYFEAAKVHHLSAIQRVVALTPAYFGQILNSN
ncbi:DEAD/DEAH box helicase [Chromobacterium piscinae]|uniref:DEAD/DEAH box helicase n=1 Tax=Chromobacterium piscinae TaxID=686831 RepID=UPI001E3CAAB4|nr:DEAD/DEAH box helicase [Chromobacterium piscinae]MCD5329374.1 DEAD/DEAH box helicase [Chromobacterium piscinae]